MLRPLRCVVAALCCAVLCCAVLSVVWFQNEELKRKLDQMQRVALNTALRSVRASDERKRSQSTAATSSDTPVGGDPGDAGMPSLGGGMHRSRSAVFATATRGAKRPSTRVLSGLPPRNGRRRGSAVVARARTSLLSTDGVPAVQRPLSAGFAYPPAFYPSTEFDGDEDDAGGVEQKHGALAPAATAWVRANTISEEPSSAAKPATTRAAAPDGGSSSQDVGAAVTKSASAGGGLIARQFSVPRVREKSQRGLLLVRGLWRVFAVCEDGLCALFRFWPRVCVCVPNHRRFHAETKQQCFRCVSQFSRHAGHDRSCCSQRGTVVRFQCGSSRRRYLWRSRRPSHARWPCGTTSQPYNRCWCWCWCWCW